MNRQFFVRFSGEGARLVFNKKDECWEYECPGKGKIVVWLDPNEENKCVYLNIKVLDVNGNQLPKKENDVRITNAVMFDPPGLFPLIFQPNPPCFSWILPFGNWMLNCPFEEILGYPMIICLTENRFGLDYLLIPERPELCPLLDSSMDSKFEEIKDMVKPIKDQYQKELEEKMEQEARENIQRTKEDWEEWERRQADENGGDREE